jgi:hypothetical protein
MLRAVARENALPGGNASPMSGAGIDAEFAFSVW